MISAIRYAARRCGLRCAKGLSWEPVKVDLFKTEQYDPKYLKLNPKGVVPTLVHNGKPVIESTLICEYTDETFKQPPYLIPVEPWRQSRMRLWSKMVDEGLHDGVPPSQFVGADRALPRAGGRSIWPSAMPSTNRCCASHM